MGFQKANIFFALVLANLMFLVEASFAQQRPTPTYNQAGQPSAPTGDGLPSVVRLDDSRAQPTIDGDGRDDPNVELSLFLGSIKFVGFEAIQPEEFGFLYEDMLETEVTGHALYGLAHDITEFYHARGYVLSQAFIPGQRIDNDSVEIWIVEGSIGSFEISGDAGSFHNKISEYAERLMDEDPLTEQTLERMLLLMNDLPGMAVVSSISPGETGMQAAHLTLYVSHADSYGVASIDNRSPAFFGPISMYVSQSMNGLFGLANSASLSVFTAAPEQGFESVGAALNVKMPIGNNGTYVQLYSAANWTMPGGFLETFGLRGETLFLSTALVHPLRRSLSNFLYAFGQIDILKSEEKILFDPTMGGSSPRVPFIEDNIQTARLGIFAAHADPFGGENHLELRLNIGLGGSALNDPLSSRTNADGKFVSVNGSYSRVQSLSSLVENLQLKLLVNGQYSSSPLLSGEEIGYGGGVLLRAYDSYDIAGDSGIAGQLELGLSPSESDVSDGSFAVPFAFYDVGAVWNNNRLYFEAHGNTLQSAGFGLHIGLPHQVFGTLYIAHQLTPAFSMFDDKDTRVFFQIGVTW